MAQSLNQTPSSNRTHIGFFGKMNAGKSSLINALADQTVSIVSDLAGTTTDVVKKPMEIHGIGPCILLDTAGFDDVGEVGSLRIAAADKAAAATDIAVLVLGEGEELEEDKKWIRRFELMDTPYLLVLSKCDRRSASENETLAAHLQEALGKEVLQVTASKDGVKMLKEALVDCAKQEQEPRRILQDFVEEGDLVVLVMPQDPQAPEGRLILPQVQTIREALDRECITLCVTGDGFEAGLAMLNRQPKLIVTDSQIFDQVYEKTPKGSLLTSFSVLFAAMKGDISYYVQSAASIESLTETSKVLIAECCTHAPMEEDIGRVKIPRMLKKKIGEGLQVDITAGTDFPQDLSDYDLIIQCGGCMFNRKYICSRIAQAKEAGVPMSNYGITIAHLKGILDKVETGA